jgi:DNA polymerase III alpha subunit
LFANPAAATAAPPSFLRSGCAMPSPAYAELHAHSNFSFLDGASAPADLAARAVGLGLSALAVTDRGGLYGVVRFAAAAEEAGLHSVIGVEVELVDALVPDPHGLVIPARRPVPRGRRRSPVAGLPAPRDGLPVRPQPVRNRLPGHREAVREDQRGVRAAERGPHLVLLARDDAGYRSLCRLLSRANLAGSKAAPRVAQALIAEHAEGLVALSGCRHGELARRLLAGDREGARAVAESYARLFGRSGRAKGAAAARGVAGAGFALELFHHLLPGDDWLVAETARLAGELGLPVVVTNDVRYARPEDRELHDVLTAIRHGRSVETLAELRTPSGEHYLKSGPELATLPPGDSDADPATAVAWRAGIANAGELAAACRVDLSFEQYRFPGFPVPAGETAFSYLAELCHGGIRRRYHPVTPPVVKQLAHELDVIERTGLAEFFLICWDLMRFAKERRIPAQGRGSAADSIVAYVLGITRVDPIRHNLLFERFINEGRTTYPDVDIDFSSARREEVIQYVYERYGAEHTAMVCNLVTYRARSAVREVGIALGFPRPLVDRVAKALETYDAVMVRRDLETDGGFAEFFRRPAAQTAATSPPAGADGIGAAFGAVPRAGPGPRAPGAAGPGLVRAAPRSAGAIWNDGIGKPGAASVAEHGRTRPATGGGSAATSWSGSASSSGGDRVPRLADAARRTGILPGTGAAPAIRAGGASDDKGGPGDSPASVAWLVRGGPPTVTGSRLCGLAAGSTPPIADGAPPSADHTFGPGAGSPGTRAGSPGTVDGRPLDPESGALAPPARNVDRLGRPRSWDPAPTQARAAVPASGSSAAGVAPELPPAPRGGSTVGMSPWERWLELCARIDGFPRHLSIHSGGMLVTAAPLIDIAPLEPATMPGRVVVQFDKRDVETLKLIKLDLLGLGMLAAIDETVQLIEHDCAVCVDLDRLPEEVPEVFAMLQAADTVGVFQVESRAQMQTLPKSRPACLDDLVVEVAIIRPGPIQGNAVHPYLRRKQGLEPVTYLHPSLEPVLRDSLGVILYQEQVMRIAIEVAGFTPAASDGFRRAMGTWRSPAEMEKLHAGFVEGCVAAQGMTHADAEELYRRVAGFASFGFAKSHAAAFARTAYESSFLKLFYPAQFLVGLVNAQPMGFYPVEVLVNDAKRHGVAVLPVDVNASSHRTTTEWVGRPGWALVGSAGDDGSHDRDPGEPLSPGAGIAARPQPVRSPACVNPPHAARERWTPESTVGWGVRLGLHLVKGIGGDHAAHLDAERARGPYTSLADVVDRTSLPEEVVERLIRAGALDSLGRPRRELLWQLRETARPAKGAPRGGGRVAGRPLDLRLPATPAPELSPLSELERLGDAYAILSLDARRQVVTLFRPALDALGAVTNAALAEGRPGPVRIGGLVVTRQHPMTAKGTVFLALEDETGMVNVTLWPDAWARLRGVVRRNALLVVDGMLQRESNVVNVVARDARPLVDEARRAGGPERPDGVRQLGHAGMRRLG